MHLSSMRDMYTGFDNYVPISQIWGDILYIFMNVTNLDIRIYRNFSFGFRQHICNIFTVCAANVWRFSVMENVLVEEVPSTIVRKIWAPF